MSTTQHPMDRLAEQPMTDQMRARLGQLFDAAIQSDPDIWEPEARPMIREAGAAYRRGGRRAAGAVVERHRRRGLHRPQAARASRASSPRRCGSRRTSSSSRHSGVDPGDEDPEHARACEGCGQPLIGKAPQARYHGDACRMRARRRAQRFPGAETPTERPTWPAEALVEQELRGDAFSFLAALMADEPRGTLTEAVAA